MNAPRRIGLVGHGAIGRIVARAVEAGEAGDWRIAAILTRSAARPEVPDHFLDPAAFFDVPVDLYVECAGPRALAAHGEAALARADVWSVSGTALADARLYSRLEAVGQAAGHRLRLVAGAVGGLDALAALSIDPDVAAQIAILAPEAGDPLDLSVEEAARRLPDGVNLAVAAALAGPGLERARVEVRRGTGARREIRLTARGALGDFTSTLVPVTDPAKGLHIVAASLIAALRQAGRTIWAG